MSSTLFLALSQCLALNVHLYGERSLHKSKALPQLRSLQCVSGDVPTMRLRQCLLLFCLMRPAAALPQENATPQIRVESQLVVLDTVVTDRAGKTVTNLTKDDFTVYENGVRQTVRDFSAPAERPSIPAAPVKDRNGHDDWGAAPLTIIVVDEMDTPFTELAYARDCVRRYLKAQPEELAEPALLLWLNDGGLHPLTGFTRNRDALLNALAKQPASLAGKLARGAVAEQVAAAFAALQQASLFSRGEAGPKQIIWVGRSFPGIDPINLDDHQRALLTKAVRSTVDRLLASRVTLDVIDPTITGSARDDDTAQEVDTLQPAPGTSIKDPFASSFNMNLFVSETGGKYFRGFNDLDRQIGESEQRGNSYYTLTYVPNPPVNDGSYRQIDIRLREPGLFAQTRKGYYAPGGEPVLQPKLADALDRSDLRFDLYEASVTGMQYTGLGLHVKSCARDGGGLRASCTITVDTGLLTFSASAEGVRTTLMGVIASLDAKGKLINNTVERMTIGIPQSEAARINTGFSTLRLHTIVPPGAKTVRIVLRDSSGRIGTADVAPDLVPRLAITREELQSARKK